LSAGAAVKVRRAKVVVNWDHCLRERVQPGGHKEAGRLGAKRVRVEVGGSTNLAELHRQGAKAGGLRWRWGSSIA
jgi:hypothetical protein